MGRSLPVIGIDGSRLSLCRRTGTENYSREIVAHLLGLDLPVDWRIYLNEPPSSATTRHWSALAETRSIPAPRLWTHGRLSAEMVRQPPDVLFVPSHVIPLIHPRSIVTIHDLGYLRYPDLHPARQRRMLDLTTRWSARTARRIIVPSQATKADLIRAHGIDRQRISVIHHGVSARFGSVPWSDIEELQCRLGLDGPYVLSVGTIQPRKNFPVLGEALMKLRRQGVDVTLVISGKAGWMADQVLVRLHALGLGERLRILDYIPDGDLPALYAGASCYVQPSWSEGFGLPVIEAMASAVPVIVSNASSLPEIAADGADLFDPSNADQLAATIGDILSSPQRSTSMATRARVRSEHFSWARAAELTAKVLVEELQRAHA